MLSYVLRRFMGILFHVKVCVSRCALNYMLANMIQSISSQRLIITHTYIIEFYTSCLLSYLGEGLISLPQYTLPIQFFLFQQLSDDATYWINDLGVAPIFRVGLSCCVNRYYLTLTLTLTRP